MKYILIFILKIASAARVLFSANVDANLVSMNLDGSVIIVLNTNYRSNIVLFKWNNQGYDEIHIRNVNVWFPGTSYLDVTRFEYLKKFRPQFDSNGTMYYIDADSGFVVAADLSASSK